MSVRQDLLSCLRWSVFEDQQEIKIASGINEHGQQMYIPLLEHHIAKQSLVQPPKSRVEILSKDVLEAQHFSMVPKDFEYKGLVIEHEDGSPVTIGEFVIQAHKHLNEFKDVITHCNFFEFWFDLGKMSKDTERLGVKVLFEEAASRNLEGRDAIFVYTNFVYEDGRPIKDKNGRPVNMWWERLSYALRQRQKVRK